MTLLIILIMKEEAPLWGDVYKRQVLHSSQFMAKTLMIPAMNTNKTLNYIQREFPGVNNDSGSVYGYFRISGNKGKGMREVFATRMERDFLDSYRKLFASVGIQINSVQAALGCVVSVLHQMCIRDS